MAESDRFAQEERELSRPKDGWDKVRACGTALVALVIGIGGYIVDSNISKREQTRSEVQFFTDLLSQREQADSELRTKMFETVFKAYFEGKSDIKTVGRPGVQEADNVPPESVTGDYISACVRGSIPSKEVLHRQVIFLDILGRNFPAVDIRPLFEELDNCLGRAINEAIEISGERALEGEPLVALSDEAILAFTERQKLRRAAKGIVERQAAVLEDVQGSKSARVFLRQKVCGSGPDRVVEPSRKAEGVDIDLYYPAVALRDGKVVIALLDSVTADEELAGASRSTRPFSVSFFDMPFLENSRIPKGDRVAIILESYLSVDEYGPFSDYLVEREIIEHIDTYHKYKEITGCREATLRIVQFPADFIGIADTPIINNLMKTALDEN